MLGSFSRGSFNSSSYIILFSQIATKEQTPQAIVLGTAPENLIRIPRDEVLDIKNLDISLLPQGLDQLLTDQEFADLIAFILGEDLNY